MSALAPVPGLFFRTPTGDLWRVELIDEAGNVLLVLVEVHPRPANHSWSERDVLDEHASRFLDISPTLLVPGYRAATSCEIWRRKTRRGLITIVDRAVNDSDTLTASMRARGWEGTPIDVVRLGDGKLTAIDNTRVLAAHRAGITVYVTVHAADDALPAELVGRFTTRAGVPQNWGEAIRLRIRKQGAAFRKMYPNGAPITGASR